MAGEPIEGVGRTREAADNDAMEIAARSNLPGAFTGDFDTGIAKAVGNNELTLGQWTAHSIRRTVESPEVQSEALNSLSEDPTFVSNMTNYSLNMLPQNRHLAGRGADSVLEEGEEYYTSFGSAVKQLAELFAKNPDKLMSMINTAGSAVGGAAMPAAQREQMKAVGQVPSVGLPVPTRVPGE
ncbi:MAG: hypothetical protein AAFQ82_24655 [Myxococcota bacterium]